MWNKAVVLFERNLAKLRYPTLMSYVRGLEEEVVKLDDTRQELCDDLITSQEDNGRRERVIQAVRTRLRATQDFGQLWVNHAVSLENQLSKEQVNSDRKEGVIQAMRAKFNQEKSSIIYWVNDLKDKYLTTVVQCTSLEAEIDRKELVIKALQRRIATHGQESYDQALASVEVGIPWGRSVLAVDKETGTTRMATGDEIRSNPGEIDDRITHTVNVDTGTIQKEPVGQIPVVGRGPCTCCPQE